MVDYHELMRIFALPRPSGSAAERATAEHLRAWLAARGIAYRSETFRLYPFFNECMGVWLIAVALLLAATVVWRLPWYFLVLVGLGVLVSILTVVRGWPLVVWPGARRGENILVEFNAPDAQRELVLATHYDSKTELFDHRRQGFFLRHQNLMIRLTLLLLLLGLLDRLLLPAGSVGALAVQLVSGILVIPVVVITTGLGLNLIPGRFIAQSQGAVDNGAACAVLLGLAARLAEQPELYRQTRVVLAFFSGEEVNMQGSRAYVGRRAWPLPAAAINLELLGQNGPYVLWRAEGNALRSVPTSAALNSGLAAIIVKATGAPPRSIGGINSDGYSFLAAGVSTAVLGSYDLTHGGTGLHRPTDNCERVVIERLPATVAILVEAIRHYAVGQLTAAAAE